MGEEMKSKKKLIAIKNLFILKKKQKEKKNIDRLIKDRMIRDIWTL